MVDVGGLNQPAGQVAPQEPDADGEAVAVRDVRLLWVPKYVIVRAAEPDALGRELADAEALAVQDCDWVHTPSF